MRNNFSGPRRPNAGNERGSVSNSSSSMKGKKNSSSQKPTRKPLRGLGVAQLERIRLHGELMAMRYFPSFYYTPYCPPTSTNEGLRVSTAGNCSSMSSSPFAHSTPPSASSNALHPTAMMGFAEGGDKFNNTPSSQDTRWGEGATNIDGQSFSLPSLTIRHLLNLLEEDSQQEKEHMSDSIRSSSQNPESSDNEEIDLELRL